MTCKIADLGLSKIVEASLNYKTETYCGTYLFMAPEVLNGLPYSHESDVWSLGCTFYAMLFGKVPFPAKTLNELQQVISSGVWEIPE